MGIENTVKKMDPKLKKLLINILSILMIVVILYGVVTAVQLYLESGNYMSIININVIVPVVVPLLFIWLAYSILSGKKIHPPDDLSGKGKKTQINIPDTYGVRGSLKKQPDKTPQKQYGTWMCPGCGYLAKGAKCNKCGYTRED